MDLFKNEVGRPSNETLRKRKIIIIVFIVLVICIIGVVFYYTSTFFYGNLSSKNKNATTYVGKRYYVSLDYKDRDHLHFFLACPDGYSLNSSYDCEKYRDFVISYLKSKIVFNNLEARHYCKTKMYDRAKNIKMTHPRNKIKKLSFTCYKKTTYQGYLASYYNQNEVNSTIKSACGGGKTLRNGGCLPSTISMVFSSLGISYNPISVNNYVKNLCSGTTCYSGNYKICDSGSFYVQLVNKLAKKHGLYVYDVDNSSELDKKLKSGKCAGVAALRAYCGGKYCYNVGHFVAVFASDLSGKVYISDPWDRNKMLVSESASNIISYTQAREVKVVCNK